MNNYLIGTFRLDPISLAKIAAYLAQQGVSPSSRNALVASAIDTLAALIKDVEAPSTIGSAHAYLDTHFPVASYRGGKRVIQKVVDSLSLQKEDPAQSSYSAYVGVMKSLGMPPLPLEEWELAKKKEV